MLHSRYSRHPRLHSFLFDDKIALSPFKRLIQLNRAMSVARKRYVKANNLKKDFGPDWAKRLATLLSSSPYMVTLEQEAWKDAVDARSDSQDEVKSDDEESDDSGDSDDGILIDEESRQKGGEHLALSLQPTFSQDLRAINLLDATESDCQGWLIKVGNTEVEGETEKMEEQMTLGTKLCYSCSSPCFCMASGHVGMRLR